MADRHSSPPDDSDGKEYFHTVEDGKDVYWYYTEDTRTDGIKSKTSTDTKKDDKQPARGLSGCSICLIICMVIMWSAIVSLTVYFKGLSKESMLVRLTSPVRGRPPNKLLCGPTELHNHSHGHLEISKNILAIRESMFRRKGREELMMELFLSLPAMLLRTPNVRTIFFAVRLKWVSPPLLYAFMMKHCVMRMQEIKIFNEEIASDESMIEYLADFEENSTSTIGFFSCWPEEEKNGNETIIVDGIRVRFYIDFALSFVILKVCSVRDYPQECIETSTQNVSISTHTSYSTYAIDVYGVNEGETYFKGNISVKKFVKADFLCFNYED